MTEPVAVVGAGGGRGAAWSAREEGERLWFLGTLATIRVSGAAVGGRFALIEVLLPHHASPPLHTHPLDETFTVLEGSLTVVAGGERRAVEVGGRWRSPRAWRTRSASTAPRRGCWC